MSEFIHEQGLEDLICAAGNLELLTLGSLPPREQIEELMVEASELIAVAVAGSANPNENEEEPADKNIK